MGELRAPVACVEGPYSSTPPLTTLTTPYNLTNAITPRGFIQGLVGIRGGYKSRLNVVVCKCLDENVASLWGLQMLMVLSLIEWNAGLSRACTYFKALSLGVPIPWFSPINADSYSGKALLLCCIARIRFSLHHMTLSCQACKLSAKLHITLPSPDPTSRKNVTIVCYSVSIPKSTATSTSNQHSYLPSPSKTITYVDLFSPLYIFHIFNNGF